MTSERRTRVARGRAANSARRGGRERAPNKRARGEHADSREPARYHSRALSNGDAINMSNNNKCERTRSAVCRTRAKLNDDEGLKREEEEEEEDAAQVKMMREKNNVIEDARKKRIIFNCKQANEEGEAKMRRSKKKKKKAASRSSLMAPEWRHVILILSAASSFASVHASGSPGDLASLVGQAGTSVRLPCLIGRQLFCGEPYFIAWYKLNPSKSGWTRIDYTEGSAAAGRAAEQQASPESALSGQQVDANQTTAPPGNRFTFLRGFNGASCDIGGASGLSVKRLAELECAQLEIGKLELADEGQYKCDITFSESFEGDKCPPSSVSRLAVIARPKEPELLLNGRPLSHEPGSSKLDVAIAATVPGSFKEGAQVKLECQSSGGKPAPRIEWLNVSRPNWARFSWSDFEQISEADVQPVRLQRKSAPTSNGQAGALISSSSALVSLSRFDLGSQFVCLVIPNLQGELFSDNQQQFRPAHWAKLLRGASSHSGRQADQRSQAANVMLKSLKFDIQVKPISASLFVRDPLRNLTLSPTSWQLPDLQLGNPMQSSPPLQANFYSLQLNQLYLIQCIVDKSKPASQIAWFNRTAPIALDPIQMDGRSDDFELPPASQHGHRLSSFVRQIAQADGTFRTVGSLLITTNIWDNYEEIFCRVSNDAFQFEELTSQVAPILSAGLYVNYAPFAKLELADQATASKQASDNDDSTAAFPPQNETISVRADEGGQLAMRCLIGANPLSQASILQVDWFKDKQKLEQATNARDPRQQAFQFSIERANQLHMGTSAGKHHHQSGQFQPAHLDSSVGDPSQLLWASSKLLVVSTLTLAPLGQSSAGSYSCQFKIIPAPGPATQLGYGGGGGSSPVNQLHSNRIISDRSKQTIELKVQEAKPKAPTLRIQSSAGLFSYKPSPLIEQSAARDDLHSGGVASSSMDSRDKMQQQQQHPNMGTVLVGEPGSSISLRCEPNGIGMATKQQQQINGIGNNINSSPMGAQHLKISWFANGNHLHSSSVSDTFNVSLATLFQDLQDDSSAGEEAQTSKGLPAPVKLSCAHQFVLVSSGADYSFSANQIRQLASSNEIELRLAVVPELEVKRLDLMPPVRSFSEHELETNPGRKFRLACRARCEPLCSLRWFINSNQPLGASSAAPSSSSSSNYYDSIATRDLAINAKSTSVEIPHHGGVILRRFEELAEPAPAIKSNTDWPDSSNSIPNQAKELNLIRFETISKLSNSSDNNWIYESTIRARFRKQELLFGEAGALKRELSDNSHSRSRQYNVYSSLELSYNHLNFLLNRDDELVIRCGIGSSGTNQWAFKHDLVGPGEWHPPSQSDATGRENPKSTARIQDVLNLSDMELKKFGEKQTRIMLDKPPTDVKLVFESALGPEVSPFGLSIAQSQLVEFSDPNKPRPILKCLVKGAPYPPPKYEWFFTYFNGTEDRFQIDGDELDFRHAIEARQRQHLADPSSAYGYDVVSSLSGNYTCLASNIHGSKAASLSVQIHGLPLCKIGLEKEYFNGADIKANLRCSIYSVPPMLETIWFQASQELVSNKTENIELTTNRAQLDRPLTSVNLTVQLPSNKNSQDPLEYLAVDYKCSVKNSLGYSHICELKQTQKQFLLDLIKSAGSSRKSSPGSMWPLSGWQLFSSSSNQDQHQNAQAGNSSSAKNFVETRIDLILASICCMLLVYFAIILISSYVRKRRKLSVPKDTNWHFSSTERRQFNLSNHGSSNRYKSGLGEAFQSSIGLGSSGGANYYGGSNGDSEHDIIQSCSQSSQYEDLLGSNQQRSMAQNFQSQALYFNHELASSAATMNRRTKCKSSQGRGNMMTTTTTNESRDSSANSNQLVHLESDHSNSRPPGVSGAFRDGTSRQRSGCNNLINANLIGGDHKTIKNGKLAIEGGCGGNSRVPLIDGTQTSRIKLDGHHKQSYLNNDYQVGLITQVPIESKNEKERTEHIYDDVIYKKMIL